MPTDTDAQLSVLLLRQKQLADSLTADVIVVPTQDSWNDFGHRIRAEVGLLGSDGKREWIAAFVALKDEKDLPDYVKKNLSNAPEGVPIASLQRPFASLLVEAKSYSLARRVFGVDRARQLLSALHDIALLSADDEDVPDWPDFFTSDVFTHAMTRNSEGHFAYRQGALVLAGRPTGGLDARMRLQVELSGVGPHLNFDFEFDRQNDLRGRIAVLIGPNGCGKTSTLARLSAGFAIDNRDGVKFIQRPEVNQVLAFAHSNAVKLFRLRRNSAGAASVRAFAFDPASAGRSTKRQSQTKLLIDIGRAHDDDGPLLKYLKEVMDQEFPDLLMHVPVIESVAADYVDDKQRGFVRLNSWMSGGEGRQLEAIASVDHSRPLLFLGADGIPRTPSLGQKTFLNFALIALANAGQASVFIIDEPENFLHPNLVSRFMRVLNRILDGTKSIAILATHSPFVVREVQSAQVHVIHAAAIGEGARVSHPRLQTLGANVASISDEVFHDDLPQHLYEQLLARSHAADMDFSRVLERYAGELSTEALMYLRRRADGRNGAQS
ncbi:AAA family ATPase [Roseateles sp.]|uniref:AAA family ATPase n=1 Tax=Roseateles sp. TaxID=1971397 RepID=UPI003BA4E890